MCVCGGVVDLSDKRTAALECLETTADILFEVNS